MKRKAYSYSCLMANIPEPLASKVRAYGNAIPNKLIYQTNDGEHGRERVIHITVKYGIHTTELKDIVSLLDDQPPIRVCLGKITSFLTDEAIVLKIGVYGEELMALNEKICKSLDCTDTYPEYRPHITIAYLQKSERNPHYFERFFSDKFDGIEVVLDSFAFTTPGGGNHLIKLRSMEQITKELVSIANILTKV